MASRPVTRPSSPTPKPKAFHSFPSNKVRPVRKTEGASATQILKDGYCHKKFLAVTTKHLLDLGQSVTVNTKGSVKLGEKTTATGAVVPTPIPEFGPSFVRLLTSVNRFGLDARVWGDGRFKLGIDAGFLDAENKNDNVFGLFRSNLQFSNWKFGLGLVHNIGSSYVLGRFRLDNTLAPLFDVKALFQQGKFKVFENFGYNFSTGQILRANAFFAYLDKDFDVVFAHESLSKKLELGRLVASLVYRYNKYAFAVQSRYKNSHARFILGVTAPLNDNTTLKAKIDDRCKLTTSGKFKLHKNCFLTVASQVRLAKGKDALDFSKPLPVPLGLSVDMTF